MIRSPSEIMAKSAIARPTPRSSRVFTFCNSVMESFQALTRSCSCSCSCSCSMGCQTAEQEQEYEHEWTDVNLLLLQSSTFYPQGRGWDWAQLTSASPCLCGSSLS